MTSKKSTKPLAPFDAAEYAKLACPLCAPTNITTTHVASKAFAVRAGISLFEAEKIPEVHEFGKTDFRFGSKADVSYARRDVVFVPEADIAERRQRTDSSTTQSSAASLARRRGPPSDVTSV